MSDSEETMQENEPPASERQDKYVPVLSKSRDSNPSGRPALTPPPPSAPSEFLEAQSHTVGDEVARQPGPAPVTPPPASAPTEFLAVQQWKEIFPKGPAELMEDFLESAAPSSQRELGPGVWPLEWQDEEPPQVELAQFGLEGKSPVVDEPVRIRGLALSRGEEVAKVLLSDEGLSDTLPSSGEALILTNRRLIAFRGVEGFRDTHMARTSDITQFSVRTGQRNWTAILQGLLMMIGGAFLYLVAGYWLAGQISGPNVPVLNIDVAPLIALLIILAGLLMLLQNYFTRPAGAVIFRGAGIEIAFPFRSALDINQIYQFVELVETTSRGSDAPGTRQDASAPLGED